MLSRVANLIFWISRYIERAENIARVLEVNQNLSLGFYDKLKTQWHPLIYVTGDEEIFEDLYGEDYSQRQVMYFLALERRYPNSIYSCVTQARENGREVRENISYAMWEELNTFYHYMQKAADHAQLLEKPAEFLDQVKRFSYTFTGVIDATMTRGEGCHFSYLGRFLERADKTSRILDLKYFILLPNLTDVGRPIDLTQWAALLNSTNALTLYRRRHGKIHPFRVVDFLLLDRLFPRSIHYCIEQAESSLRSITGAKEGHFSNRSEQLLGRMKAELNYARVEDIVARGLHEFIDGFQLSLNEVGEAIASTFFAPPLLSQRIHSAAEKSFDHYISVTE